MMNKKFIVKQESASFRLIQQPNLMIDICTTDMIMLH